MGHDPNNANKIEEASPASVDTTPHSGALCDFGVSIV